MAKKKCVLCKATGQCPSCRGEGRIARKGFSVGYDACPTCKRSKVCPSCKGTRMI